MNTIIASVQQEELWRGRARVCVECTYIKDRRKSVRTRLLDRNDGAARRFASEKESDPVAGELLFAHDSLGFRILATIPRCAIWWWFSGSPQLLS